MTPATFSPAPRARLEVIPAVPKVRGGVQYDPPVSAERLAGWQAELAKIAPRSEELSWLHLSWVSGDPWEWSVGRDGFTRQPGIGRFFIWQMVPFKLIDEFVLPDLQGPHPRTFSRWDTMAVCQECEGWKADCKSCGGRGRGAFVQDRPCTINRYQWELFHETGALAKPYWIVQGTRGGHLRRFTPVQASLSVMNGGPAEPPLPGELPYAEPDRRTFSALVNLDGLRNFDLMLTAYQDRTPEQMEDYEKRAVQAMREQMWTYLSNQIESRIRDERPLLRHMIDNRPVGVGAQRAQDDEAVHRRFVETRI